MKRLFYSLFFISSLCNAQELVKDINTIASGQGSYDSKKCFSCGGKVYLAAQDGEHGLELWVTDGTASGTRLVKDLNPGPPNGIWNNLRCSKGKMYFAGSGLWRTDATEAGTEQVFSYAVNDYSISDNKIIFLGNDNTLYSINDDLTGLAIVKAFDTELSLSPIATTSDKIFIGVSHYSQETYILEKSELWVYAGTSFEPVFEAAEGDIVENLIAFNDRVIFDAGDGGVYASDGTEEGTELLAPAMIANHTPVNVNGSDKILLRSLYNFTGTWFSDGTQAGTFQVFDDLSAKFAIQYNDDFYFVVQSQNGGPSRIIKTDDSYDNREDVAPEMDGDGNMILGIVNDKLLYAGSSEDGVELHSTDGGTNTLVKDINPGEEGSYPRTFMSTGNSGFFLADDGVHSYEFWKTDGTANGTSLIKDIFTGTNGIQSENLYLHNNKVYFQANSDNAFVSPHWGLWQSDGTSEGTTLLDDTGTYYGYFFLGAGKYVVTGGLMKTDLDNGDVSLLKNVAGSGYSGGPRIKTQKVGDDYYFFSNFSAFANDKGTELWKINAVENEFVMMKDINPGPASSYQAEDWATLGDKLVFAPVSPDGIEPWVTDGTEEGTIELKNIQLTSDSYARGFVTMGNKVYFIATTGGNDSRRTIWVTDGTPQGTTILKELGEKGGVASNDIGVIGNQIVFGWSPGDGSIELWKSDGTVAGTASFVQMPQVKYGISDFTTVGNRVIFLSDYEDLWTTDGTAGGTSILDFAHNSTIFLESIKVVDGVAYFLTADNIWRTEAVTVSLIGPARPIGDFVVNDNYILFLQDDPQYGRELFRYDLSEITGLGSEEDKKIGSVIYPNPTTNTLFVRADSPSALRIVDMSGREKHSQFINSDVSIDVSSYADGMYVVILNSNHFKFIKR